MLGAGALGRPRGMEWGGRREEGSGWGTHVYLWRIPQGDHPPPYAPTLTTLEPRFTSDVKVILLNDHRVPQVGVVPKGKDQLAAGPCMVLHLPLPGEGQG